MNNLFDALPLKWKVIVLSAAFALVISFYYWKVIAPYLPWALIGLVVLGVAWAGINSWLRRNREKRLRARLRKIHQAVAEGPTHIILPRRDGDPVDPAKVMLWARLGDMLADSGEHCALELSGNNEGLRFSVHASRTFMPALLTQFQAEWPKVQRRETGKPSPVTHITLEDPLVLPENWKVAWLEMAPSEMDAPITTIAVDPLMAVLVQMAEFPDNLRGAIQVIARPNPTHRQRLAQQSTSLRSASASTPAQAGTRATTNKQAKELDTRAARTFLDAVVRVVVMSPDQSTADLHVQALARTLVAQFGPTNPMTILNRKPNPTPAVVIERALTTHRPWADTELGLVGHLVGRDAFAQASQLHTARAAALLPSPASRIPRNARVCAMTDPKGQSIIQIKSNPEGAPWIKSGTATDSTGGIIEVGFPLVDSQTHISAVGTTGSGKSVTLGGLGAQCIGLGSTVYVQEPHGDLCKALIASLPDTWLYLVKYFDLNSPYPPAFPIMTLGLDAGINQAVASVMRALRVAEPASWDASQKLRDLLLKLNKLLLMVESRKSSLISLNRLLKEDQGMYREWVLATAPEEVAEEADYLRNKICPGLENAKGTTEVRNAIEGARRRLGLFIGDDRLRRSLACSPILPEMAINMRALLSGGNLVLAPVRETDLGESQARVLGTLLIEAVNAAFLSRTDDGDRLPTVIMLDEFPDMAGSEVGQQIKTLLAQLRKFGACGVLAAQAASQLPDDVKAEFNGNTNIKIVLAQTSDDDARAAIKAMGTKDILPPDLINVEQYHGYIRPVVDKTKQPPAYLNMLPPVRLVDDGRRDSALVESLKHLSAPQNSAEFNRIRDLAREATKPLDPTSGREVIRRLTQMDEPTWNGMVAECRAMNLYAAAQLLFDPRHDPDKVQRAIKISRGLYGFQWYFLEAHTRRLRQANFELVSSNSQPALQPE